MDQFTIVGKSLKCIPVCTKAMALSQIGVYFQKVHQKLSRDSSFILCVKLKLSCSSGHVIKDNIFPVTCFLFYYIDSCECGGRQDYGERTSYSVYEVTLPICKGTQECTSGHFRGSCKHIINQNNGSCIGGTVCSSGSNPTEFFNGEISEGQYNIYTCMLT